jgi:hypothetical protein
MSFSACKKEPKLPEIIVPLPETEFEIYDVENIAIAYNLIVNENAHDVFDIPIYTNSIVAQGDIAVTEIKGVNCDSLDVSVVNVQCTEVDINALKNPPSGEYTLQVDFIEVIVTIKVELKIPEQSVADAKIETIVYTWQNRRGNIDVNVSIVNSQKNAAPFVPFDREGNIDLFHNDAGNATALIFIGNPTADITISDYHLLGNQGVHLLGSRWEGRSGSAPIHVKRIFTGADDP